MKTDATHRYSCDRPRAANCDQQLPHESEDQRIPEVDAWNRLSKRNHVRFAERKNQDRQGYGETCNGSSNADIKQNLPRTQRRTYADECPQSSNQAGKWNKEWQRCIHAIFHAVEIVSHLMRQQN